MNRLFKDSAGELRWGWKAAVVIMGTVAFGIILSSLLVTALTVAYSSQGLAQQQALARATDTAASFEAQILLSLLQLGFMIWLVRWLVRKMEGRPFDWSDLGLQRAPDRSRLFSLGASLAVMINLSVIGIGLTAGTLRFWGYGFELFSPMELIRTLLLGIVLAFASGFGEELVFRGYLQSRIAKRYNPGNGYTLHRKDTCISARAVKHWRQVQ